jgi:uncharacterized repeat protein (TIGR03803 family)
MNAQRRSLYLHWPLITLTAILIGAGSAFAASEQILHRFQLTDGEDPVSNLISDPEGNLYGTTEDGGVGLYGTVFKLSPPTKPGQPWTNTVLYSFFNKGDGARPIAGVIFDSKGNLYGATSDSAAGGYGEVFELTPAADGQPWTETVLYHFRGEQDGDTPLGSLVFDEKGNLYGTTFNSVFELTPPAEPGGAWTFTLLHELVGGLRDGRSAQGGVVRDAHGNLYGATLFGGYQENPYCGILGCGTVFELSPPATVGGAWTEHIVHFFGMGNDGIEPLGGVTLDAKGNLYGTTDTGGAYVGGIAYELTPPPQAGDFWTETVIHNFNYSSDDGAAPSGTMVQDADGNLYGTTLFGGNYCIYNATPYGCGTVFELSPPGTPGGNWQENIIYFFPTPPPFPKHPTGGVLLDQYGNLYGTSAYGGYAYCVGDPANGCGTVFKITR